MNFRPAVLRKHAAYKVFAGYTRKIAYGGYFSWGYYFRG